MDFISIDGNEYTKLKNESIKYEILCKYLMSKLRYNNVTKEVDFYYKFPEDTFIDFLKALDKRFENKIDEIERSNQDEDTN